MKPITLFGLASLVAVVWLPGISPPRRPAVDATTRIEGRVREADTGQPIGGAQVFVSGTMIGTRTNPAGRYVLELGDGFESGAAITVTVRLIGYAEASSDLTIEAGRTHTLDFELSQTTLALQDPVVTGESGRTPRLRLPFTLERRAAVRPAAPSSEADSRPALKQTGLAGVPRYRRPRASFNTESYARIDENGWASPMDEPLSTFAIDVDRASYSNVRRFIMEGRRPPIDAVRIEELVNYFSYDYPEASAEQPFTISTELARAPWNPDHRLVRVGIRGRSVDLEDLPPSNFVFLLDVSGSMQAPNKLPLLKRSLRLLVNELRDEDRVAIVVYAGAAGLVLESTPGRQRGRLLHAIERLEAGGSTAGGAGLRLAYEVAARNHIDGGNNRVILATDGDFNVGASSDAEMTRLIERRRDLGTFLTVLGFGMGNLKDSKLEAIANHGNGNYAYIDNLLEARKVLVTEMGGTLLTIAKDVKIQVEFNPAAVQAYRLIGYENRLLAAEDFNDDTKDAGELGAGHTVTALYEVVPVGATPVGGSVDPLRYRSPGREREGGAIGSERESAAGADARDDELMFVKLRYKRPEGDRSRLVERPVLDRTGEASEDLRFAAAVAAFGMILRESEHCGDFALSDVAELARGAVGADPHGYRSEFVRLVEATREMELIADFR